ncbi:MAG: GTP cyclohydrolase MptA [Candidatus Bathyarchaeia archaeon]
MKLPDVQNKRAAIPISLQKVGVVGVKTPIGYVSFHGKPVVIIPTFDVFIDLPSKLKGIHASRSYEVILEIIGRHVGQTYKLEDICAVIAKELLNHHVYATRSEVKAYGEAILEKPTPKLRKISYESCDLTARAVGKRGAEEGEFKIRKQIGVGITGLTACPCAQEILRDISKKSLTGFKGIPKEVADKFLDSIPIATHMQRSYSSIFTDVPEGFELDAARIADVIEDSMSAPTFGLLKRSDEAEVVKMAAERPRFVEDCIRHMMRNFIRSFPELPDTVVVEFKVRSSESVHKHDLVTRRKITVGELRRELRRACHSDQPATPQP